MCSACIGNNFDDGDGDGNNDAVDDGEDDGDEDEIAAEKSDGSGSGNGQVPAGTDDSLAAELLAAVGSFPGGKTGNKRLLERLGWDEATYKRIKAKLVAERRLKPRRGKGGGVELPDNDDPPA